MKSRLSIQERLKDLRTERKLKLEELSNLTGISKSALGSYEADDYKEINHGNLVILADFYDDPASLFVAKFLGNPPINVFKQWSF